MHELIRKWGGEFVVSRFDAATGAMIWVAVHRSHPEAATGGTRMKFYSRPEDGLRDALRLSEGMSLKFAALNLPRGGGKAVIDAPEELDVAARGGLLDRYAAMVEKLGGVFHTGPDLGTSPADMDRIADHTSYVFGTSSSRGGAGDPGPFTAQGVFEGIRAGLAHRLGSGDLRGRRVLVQGLGGVGSPLAKLLHGAGAEVSFSDVNRSMRTSGEEAGYRWIEPQAALSFDGDVLAPCALGGVLNPETIGRLRCRIVAGSANNQLGAPADAERLRERGIVYAPDYVINAGGAIFLPGREGKGLPIAALEEQIRDIGVTLLKIVQHSDKDGISSAEAARRLADAALAST